MKHNLRDNKGHFRKKEPRGAGLQRYNTTRQARYDADKKRIIAYLNEAKMFCTAKNIALSLTLPEAYVRRRCHNLRKQGTLAKTRRTTRRKERWGTR